jgi:hypothetical protein
MEVSWRIARAEGQAQFESRVTGPGRYAGSESTGAKPPPAVRKFVVWPR